MGLLLNTKSNILCLHNFSLQSMLFFLPVLLLFLFYCFFSYRIYFFLYHEWNIFNSPLSFHIFASFWHQVFSLLALLLCTGHFPLYLRICAVFIVNCQSIQSWSRALCSWVRLGSWKVWLQSDWTVGGEMATR